MQQQRTNSFLVKKLVFCAAALALATVASLIKLPLRMPYGGSVTLLSMFFICFIGYLYGVGTGLVTAVAYGILQLIIEPYIISIPQLIFDYILAFGALGLSGLFHKVKGGLIKGYLVGILGRFIFAYLSGLIFFAQYAADYGTIPIIYSAVYNGAYIGTEAVITLIIIVIPPVAAALERVKRMALEK
jgi:thiamine transporter